MFSSPVVSSVSFRRLAAALLVVSVLTASGCATASLDDVIKAASTVGGGVGAAYIDGVTFYPPSDLIADTGPDTRPDPRPDLMCGPSSLVSVLNFMGGDVSIGDASRALFNEKLGGTLSIDMLIYAKGRGFDARYYSGGLGDAKALVRSGTPPILFLNLGVKSYPVGHFVVLIGYNDEMESAVIHSGTEGGKVVGYAWLLKRWKRTGYSTLVVAAKEGGR